MALKIAIQTLKLFDNYGGILQAYALQYYLTSLGYEAIHLNRYNKPDGWLKIKLLLHRIRFFHFHKNLKRNEQLFAGFIRKQINLSPSLYSKQEWDGYIRKNNFIALIVGSDQVWRFQYVSHLIPEFFLNYDLTKVIKISYAASFGVENADAKHLEIVESYLAEFDGISVRERQGVAILRGINLESEHHLDPTLLLNKHEYTQLFNLRQNTTPESVFCYVLDKNIYKQQVIDVVSKHLSLPYRVVYGGTPNTANYRDLNIENKPTVELWLQNFLTAAFVVTDSFHGMLFSVIFNKPFIVFGNEKRGLSRFASFLKMIDLEDRLILVGKDIDNGIIDKNINFDAVNRVIANEKLNSIAYFNRHLK
jgi:hypothetical protein